MQIEEHRSLPATLWEEWRALWERCPGATAFQSAEWVHSWCAHLMTGEPCVLAFRRQGVLVGLAPFFVWNDGRRRVLSLLGAGGSDYQDMLVRQGGEEGGISALARWVVETRWGRVEWSELPAGSVLRRVPIAGAGEDLVQDVCPGIPVEADGPAARPQMLQQAAQLRRRAERAAGVTVEAAEDPGSVQAMLEDLTRWT